MFIVNIWTFQSAIHSMRHVFWWFLSYSVVINTFGVGTKLTLRGRCWFDVSRKEDETKSPPATALVNVQLRNSMALLRRCCNHPYLIEYPMDNGQLRVDESLVTACGKLMLLDRMLTELKTNGHKVWLCLCIQCSAAVCLRNVTTCKLELKMASVVRKYLAIFLYFMTVQPVHVTQ